MSLPLCPSKICISGFNSPHIDPTTCEEAPPPTHPAGLRLTPTVFQQARKAASILRPRASEATVGVPGGVACHLDVHLHRPGKWSWKRRTPLALATRGGGRLGIAPKFLPFPSNRATKVNIVIFASCVEPMYTTGAVSWSLQVWGWGRYYSAQLDIDELSESGDWESTFSYCLLPSHAYQ